MAWTRGWWALLPGLLSAGCGYSAASRASGWQVVETANVRLETDNTARRAVQLAEELQRDRDLLAAAARCETTGRGVRVAVTALASGDLEPTSEHGDGSSGTGWIAGYDDEIVIADEGFAGRLVFRHRVVHRIVAACMPGAPSWLDEGLALFLGTADLSGGAVRLGRWRPMHLDRPGRRVRTAQEVGGKWRLSAARPSTPADRLEPPDRMWNGREGWFDPRRLPAVAALIDMRPERFRAAGDAGAEEANRAAAWTLVYLLELAAPDLRGAFASFLQAVRSPGADAGQAFRSAFAGVDLQGRFERLLHGQQTLEITRPTSPPRRAPARSRAMSEPEAHIHRAWLLAVRHTDEARARARQHIESAREDPRTRARAHLVAAAMRFQERDWSGAEREVIEGLRSHPADPELLHARVDIQLARGADPTAAAGSLRRVARTAGQWCALARVELARGDRAAARELAAKALELDPSSARCRRVEREAAGPPAS